MPDHRVAALTFDCYGTLVQWPERLEDLLSGVTGRHGVVAGPAELRQRFRRHQHQLAASRYQRYAEILAEALGLALAEVGVTVDETDRRAFVDGLRDVPPYADVPDALRELGRARRLLIISNSDDDLIAATVRGLGATVDGVVTAQQARAYKPAHAIFNLALERAAVPASQVVHVGASGTLDMVPARDLGLRRIWVDRYDAGSVEGQPNDQIPSLAQLPAVIAKLESEL